MSGVVFVVFWIASLFFFVLAWIAAGVYSGRYRWIFRALAFGLLIRPVLVGFAPMPVIFGFLIYGSPDHSDYPEFIRCVKAAGSTTAIAWLALELVSRANKYAEDHKHHNPLLGKRK